MKDGRFPLQAELINLDTNRLLAYDEFHYRAFREIDVILDPRSGEAVEWEPDETDPENTLESILQQQPWLMVKKVQKPTVKLAIVLGGKMMYDGPNILKIDSYPFVPVLAYHEPDIQAYSWRIQGVIRNLRDAQYLYNRRKVIELDILESQINSGWVYPIDAVTDPKAFRQTGQGFLIPLKAGHTAQEIERITPPDIPQSMIQLSMSLAEDITKISGVNEELLGAATDDKAGILSMLRQGAGLTTLQTLFDKLDYSQRLLGKIRMDAVRKNFSPGKVRNIIGREPEERFYTSNVSKYDIAVEEGVYSTTQRQMELQQLLHFRTELGMQIPDESILRASVIQNKDKLIDDLNKASQQQAQAQQQASEVQMQQMQSEVMSAYAKTKSDLALSKERMANATAKMVSIDQIEADAEQSRTQAELDLIKQIIELEDMDLQGIRNALELAETIKSLHNAAEQPTAVPVPAQEA
jgi:hypothetical protein